MISTEVTCTACAKVILCGEHAVVYGRPAIALPLPSLRSRATVIPGSRPFHISAPDIHAEFDLSVELARPLAVLVRLVFESLQQPIPGGSLTITSDIPPSSHLGSSASVAVACARAVAAYSGHVLPPSEASRLAFEAEKIYHGSPSGIDNTVIAFEQPVWYVRGQQVASADTTSAAAPAKQVSGRPMPSKPMPATFSTLTIAHAPLLVVADTGLVMPTRIPVGDLRDGWNADPQRYEALFDQIADVVTAAREALQTGDWLQLGRLMDANHALLQQLGVSCLELDHLCDVARGAGALGAKLSGGGRGGNMIALTSDEQTAAQVRAALMKAGATRVI